MLKHIYVDQRLDVEKGKAFGSAGPYERITGWAVYDPSVRVEMEYLKPRDPAKGNGALVLISGRTGSQGTLMQKGYTVLQVKTGDAAAVRELVSFLRYGGGPDAFLLGDQHHFLKRAVIAGDADTLESILLTNTDASKRRLFDGVVITGSKPYKAAGGLKSVQAKAQIGDAVVELDSQLGSPRK
jgi:hypothetical protein